MAGGGLSGFYGATGVDNRIKHYLSNQEKQEPDTWSWVIAIGGALGISLVLFIFLQGAFG